MTSFTQRARLRGVPVLLAVLLLAGALVAAGHGFAEPTGSSAPPLSLTRAKELCRQSSAMLGMALAQSEVAVLEEQQAKETAALIPDALVISYEVAQYKYLQPANATVERVLATAAVQALESNLELQVTKAYLGALAAERFLALAQSAAGRAEDQVSLANKLYEAGMAARKDVLDAEAAQAGALAGVVSAQRGLDLAYLGLARLTGLSPAELPSLDPASVAQTGVAPSLDVAQAIAAAKLARYEAVKAREYVKLAQLNLELAETYPSGGVSSLIPGELPPGIELPPEWSAEPSWERSNAYTIPKADAQLRSAIYAERLALEQLEFEVRAAYLDLGAVRQRTTLLEPAVTAAHEGLRLAELRYEAGLSTNLEVLAAGLSLANAEASYQAARYEEMTAVASAEHAYGPGSAAIYPGSGQTQ